MNYTIYKPNPKNTGGLVNFKIATTKNEKKDSWEKTLFAEFVPQKTWNDDKKFGSFDADKKRFVAISVMEAGEILYSIESKKPFQNYHKSGDRSCWIKFGHWEGNRKVGRPEDKGFWEGKVDNYVIAMTEKGNAVSVPLSSGEAMALKLLLESFIKESMAIDAKEQDKKRKEGGGNTTKSAPKEGEDDFEEEIEDDDVPF